ncbi:MAG: peptidoglycan DD-metalloendopeptidase family protein [Ferruginibacter sp.]|nr:peptidoglycan DD-metalloendopeptidase family protein [Cytophagales bacterium]
MRNNLLRMRWRIIPSITSTLEDFRPGEVFFASGLRSLVLVLLLGVTSASYAQNELSPGRLPKNKQQLEREKKQNLKKIAETNQILKETSQQKEANIGQLSALQQQIASRTQVINSIAGEVQILNGEVRELFQVSAAMERDLANLRKEYAAMVYAAAKATTSYSKMLFLFSAPTFTQMAMRFKYLQQYSVARQKQVKQVEKIRIALHTQRRKFDVKKQEKQKLLDSQVDENQTLLSLKLKQSQVVEQLSQQESQLRDELAASEKAVNRLEKLLTDLVEEEIRKAAEARRASRERTREEATAAEETAERTAIALTPETAALASSFANNKAKLPWPVKSGFISGKFGQHEHPVLKGVYLENKGVNIQTNKGEIVRSVYDGVVISVASIPGLHQMVVVQHGDYITVYTNLSRISVQEQQKVKVKDALGEVFTDKDGVSQLQFQIWKNFDRLNPEAWLFEK